MVMAAVPTRPMVINGILEEAIVRSTKNQTNADDELIWLRRRLEAKRRDPPYQGAAVAVLKQASGLHQPTIAGAASAINKENVSDLQGSSRPSKVR